MTNVLHSADFHTRANTGITFAINGLIAQAQSIPGMGQSALIGVGDSDMPPPPGAIWEQVSLTKNPIAKLWRYAPEYRTKSREIIAKHSISVVHVHGVWMHPQYAAVQAASDMGVASILTNHGLLEHWARTGGGLVNTFKKSVYLSVMQKPMLDKVTVFHAITPRNRDELQELFPGARVEIIPNSIDISALDAIHSNTVRSPSERYILFIGRIAPQKGLDLLVEAFSRANIPRDIKLLIVGPEEFSGYAAKVRRLVSAGSCGDRVEWRPPVWSSKAKYELMRDAMATFVPSRSEVVSLVNLESSACLTPTITTHTTGLFDWESGGGLLIEADVGEITQALENMACWSDEERAQRGRASRSLVEKRYSTAATDPQWLALYRSLT